MTHNRFLSYSKARTYVRALKLKSSAEWENWVNNKEDKHGVFINSKGQQLPQRPKNIPVFPNKIYSRKGKWISWSDFLGTPPKKEKYMPYDQARTFVRSLNLKNHAEWEKWHDKHKPKRIPKKTSVYISAGTWVSWSDFLGTWAVNSVIKKKMQFPLMQARAYVHKLHLKTTNEYIAWWKLNRPLTIPLLPGDVYKSQGFAGMRDFLGTSLYSRMQINTIDVSVLYIAYSPSYPNNVFKIQIDNKGYYSATDSIFQSGCTVVKMFQYSSDNSSALKNIMQRNCTTWWQGTTGEYVVANIYQLLTELDMVFDQVTIK